MRWKSAVSSAELVSPELKQMCCFHGHRRRVETLLNYGVSEVSLVCLSIGSVPLECGFLED